MSSDSHPDRVASNRTLFVPCSLATVVFSLAALGAGTNAAHAVEVWTGLTFEFEKTAFGSQVDQITSNVGLTRGDSAGLYNDVTQDGYVPFVDTGPDDTEWATEINNPGDTVSATNWEALTFDDWQPAYEGGNRSFPENIEDTAAVVHLMTDGIYLDIQFTSWGQFPTSGGSFTYMRAEAPPPPPMPTGDYNGNDLVDVLDYVVFRDTLGDSVAMDGDGADGNANGMIDHGDYVFWLERFGDVVSASTSGAAVPEPGTLLLALAALLASATLRQPKRHPC